jgi:polar amino acid transport system substrate-binding protein
LFCPTPSWAVRRRAQGIAAGLFCSIVTAGLSLIQPVRAQEPAPFRLCADPDNLPFSSSSEATPGFYIEVGREIAQALGRPFQPVWVPTYNTKRQVRQKMLSGQCDGFAGVPDDTSFMGPRLIFSRPIVPLGYALVAPPAMGVNGVTDLHGRRVAVQWSSPPQDLLAAENDVQTVTVLSPEEAMQDLRDNKADAAFIWGASAGWLNITVMHGAYRVVPVAGDHMQWSAAIAFPRDRTALHEDVDRALSELGASIDILAVKYGFPPPVSSQTQPNGAGVSNGLEMPASNPPGPSQAAAPSAADIAGGQKLFNQNCAHCHGPNAVQGEQRRNLRLLRQRYGEAMRETFINTVTHGRVSKGMPNWSGIITMDEFQKILAFLTSVQEPAP